MYINACVICGKASQYVNVKWLTQLCYHVIAADAADADHLHMVLRLHM